MRRSCNLELQLTPLAASASAVSESNGDPLMNTFGERRKREQEEQQLTIFYNGQIAACCATELQARTILLLASRETEERLRSPSALQSPSLHSPTVGPSMKRSLKRFLQKRKGRHQATYPYHVET